MNIQKASSVGVSFTLAHWTELQYLISNAITDKINQIQKQFLHTILNDVEIFIQRSQTSQGTELEYIWKPSTIPPLIRLVFKPSDSKRDKDKEKKEMFSKSFQSSLDIARQRILVTTGDIKGPYEIVRPVYFQVSNKGIFSSQFGKLEEEYKKEIRHLREQGQIAMPSFDWGFLYGEYSVGQNSFEKAFIISIQELSKRAHMLDADGVVYMRQDIDLDTHAFQYFYLQMYGTAIRLV